MTSAITRGWRMRERGQWSNRQKVMMMLAYDGTRHVRAGVLACDIIGECFTWMINKMMGFFES